MEEVQEPGCSSDRFTLHKIPPEDVPEVWPLVADWVKEGLDTSRGKLLVEDIVTAVILENMHLWVIREAGTICAMGLTEFRVWPRKKALSIVAMLGGGAREWKSLMPELERWAIMQGCDLMWHIARKGWARLLSDYDMTHVILEKELEVYHA